MNPPTQRPAHILPFPGKTRLGDAGSPESFEKSAAAFMEGSFSPESFLALCNKTLDAPGNYLHKKAVIQYRYLALMRLCAYYEAMEDAYTIRNSFQDFLLHYQMMCSIFLCRKDYFKAVEYIGKAITVLSGQDDRTRELEQEKAYIVQHARAIPHLPAIDLSREMTPTCGNNEFPLLRRHLFVSGKGEFMTNEDSERHYIVYKLDSYGEKPVICQLAPGEEHFYRRLGCGKHVHISGTFLDANEHATMLHPCYILEAAPTAL